MKIIPKISLFIVFLLNFNGIYSQEILELFNQNISNQNVREISFALPFFEKERNIKVAVSNGFVIAEGDIIIGTETDIFGQSAAGIDANNYKWENGVMPYTIQSNHPSSGIIKQAIKYVDDNTNVCLKPRSNESDYVHFVVANGCSSWIGRQGGKQNINLSVNCSFGNAVHEICHALGMYHEHTRQDRDNFVIINWNNIQAGRENNFEKYPSFIGVDIGNYDYGSIMHYPEWAFSNNGQNTIDLIIPPATNSTQIGQRTHLSSGDIHGINSLYPTASNCNSVSKSICSHTIQGNFNGDSHSDLAYFGKCGTVSSDCWRVHINNDNGEFVTRNYGDGVWTPGDKPLHTPVTGDFNNDGYSDIAYFGKCGTNSEDCWRVHLNNKNGGFARRNYGDGVWTSGDKQIHTPISGDFNNDGYSDVAYFGKCGTNSEDCWRVHINNKNGKFVAKNYGDGVWTKGNKPIYTPVVGDFNNDGYSDIAYFGKCGTNSEDCWRVHINNKNGKFVAKNYGDGVWTSGDKQIHTPVSGDFNNDGYSDIAYFGKCGTNSEDCWRVHINNKNGKFVAKNYGDKVWYKSSCK